VHIISRKKLLEFSGEHADAFTPLNDWYRIAKSARWQSLVEVREIFPHADIVGKFTVFNIKGNDYRLIAEINYRKQTIYVRHVLSHKEYERGRWKI
jgi:mRNA interferase HigB